MAHKDDSPSYAVENSTCIVDNRHSAPFNPAFVIENHASLVDNPHSLMGNLANLVDNPVSVEHPVDISI
ncbi:hypothetical protein AVEN_267026-1, partial [Araneus ventricosus]